MNLRKFAKGQPCTLRILSVCNDNPETTVLAHGRGAGMGTKLVDYIGVHACSSCHAWLDGSPADYHRNFARALRVTLNRIHDAGGLD